MAVAILELGSTVSAAAPSSAAFIIGRAISGCGASGIVTGVFIAIAHSVPLHLRPIYNSTVGALECIASIVAPVIGGGFTIVILVFFFQDSKNQTIPKGSFVLKLKQLNFLHLFVFSISIVCLLLALEWGGATYSWSSGRIIGLLVVFGVTFTAFVALETLRRDNAVIPPSILSNKTMRLCVLYAFCASAAFNLSDYFVRPSVWIGWQIMYGVGMGLAIPQPWSASQTTLAAEDIPAGMTAIAFAISTGAALFISISQNIFTNLLRQGLSNIPDIDVDSITKQGATNLLKTVPATQTSQVIDVYNFAVTRTFWSCVAVVCLGLVAALGMDWNSVKTVSSGTGNDGEEEYNKRSQV
ncbi:major facilitator superfamily transporter protein [Rutstroemia sp. NJR-2017a BBW]|nr:major facilitator superfamily transporter protein [Rutstroemia sp. NJR-2017a BBW]